MSDPNEPNTNPPSKLPPYRQPAASTPNPKDTKTWLLLIPVMVVVLVAGILLGKYWGSNEPSALASNDAQANASDPAGGIDTADSANGAAAEQSVLSVETVAPSQETVGNTLTADGTINAKDIANVSAKVNGVAIEQVLVDEGSQVKAGQVLAIFDTDVMQQQVVQAEADVAEAQATLANASADAARVLPLIDIDAISQQEADRYRTAEVRARAALQSAKARLSSQRLTVSNAKVTAPVSGIISEKLVDVGMVAGNEPLFTIIKNGVLEWRADIDPKLVTDINIGTPVSVSLPQDQSVMGEVRRIAPTADNNRQITIYATLNSNRTARAGMYQSGEFLLGRTRMQTLPNSAIVSNDGYDYVMLVTDISTKDGKTTGRIQQQRVNLGERLGANVVVTDTLPVDSQVVKQGGSFLNDGDLVRVVDSQTAPSTQASS